MLNIKPVSEAHADKQTSEIFDEMKKELDTNVVPILFRYMANYPDFLKYAWDRIKPVISSFFFQDSRNQIENLSEEMVKVIYYPSTDSNKLVNSLSNMEKQELEEKMIEISGINASLMLISIAIRESLKGIIIEDKKLLGNRNDSTYNPYINEVRSNTPSQNLPELSQGFLPAIEFESILVVRYPEFYKFIALEMLNLSKTEKYLKSRVELERIGQMLIESFPVSINFPFSETVGMLRKNPHPDEILYLLNATFPSQYPHHLLTGSVMKQSLNPTKGLQTV